MDRLTELEAFTTVVDQGGYTGAAKRMGISKSSVSKHIASLEARLGVRLLNRTTRRVSPTDLGLAYYERALKLLRDAAEADALVQSLYAPPAGVLRVGVPRDFGATCLVPIIGRFLTKHPQVKVDIVFTDDADRKKADEFDITIGVGEPNARPPAVHTLAETTMKIVASGDYLRRRGTPSRIDDLKDHALLHDSNAPDLAYWTLVAPTSEVRRVRTGGDLTVNDGRSLLDAAVSGLGIALLPGYLVAGALRAGHVLPALDKVAQTRRTIFAVSDHNIAMQPKVRAFLEFITAAFQDASKDWV